MTNKTVLTLATLLVTNGVLAKYQQAHIDTLMQTKACPQVKECKLEDYNFSGQNLSGFNFSKTGKIREVDLERANFSNTTLEGTNFFKAKLKGSNFSGAYIKNANFSKTSFDSEDGKTTSFAKAKIHNTNFEGVKYFKRANFAGATFYNVTLPDGTLFSGKAAKLPAKYNTTKKAVAQKAVKKKYSNGKKAADKKGAAAQTESQTNWFGW